MENKNEIYSNPRTLISVLLYADIAAVSATGVELWPIHIIFMLIMFWVFHGVFVAPAGALRRCEVTQETVTCKHILSKKTVIIPLDNANFYVYRAYTPNLVISEHTIESKKEAKRKLKSGEAVFLTFYSSSKILAKQIKTATVLK